MPSPEKPRFLIGNGERLTEDARFITGPKPTKEPAYSIEEAAFRLAPRLSQTVRSIDALPELARPRGQAIALVTLHPEFLAKTQFPGSLFAGVGLRAVGSRARRITPDKWTPKHKPIGHDPETIELYVAGSTQSFARWAESLELGGDYLRGIEDLPRIEDIRPLDSLDRHGRVRLPLDDSDSLLLEASIHLPDEDGAAILASFKNYAATLGVKIMNEVGVAVPGLAFAPVRVPRSAVARLSQFAFLRSLRPVVKLRGLPSSRVTRSLGAPFAPPTRAPLNPSIRVAVLDGGVPDNHGLPHVKQYATPGVAQAHPNFLEHGLAVTGAFLWGALHAAPGMTYASVDHFRVLDVDDQQQSDLHAYRILRRVRDVVETGSHDIFNLSLGPDISVDDDEVHPWTSTLDDLAADGSRLIVAAAGNNGAMPEPLCRIQVPGDGVNCLCVGAADSPDEGWRRAPYSAKGPGRRPGVTKPDIMAFGGGSDTAFRVVRRRGATYTLDNDMGTSFAAPLVTRAAAALRSLFSANLHPLTLKCLLIHSADQAGHTTEDVGWGRIASEAELPLCPDNTARVIYQGDLPPKQLLRARIPIPKGLTGRIEITATICYATEVRASDPLNYTNSGVEVAYRPNAQKHSVNKETERESTYAQTAPFFKQGDYATEEERRTRDRKWETVLHATKRVEASKLSDPVFDLHFIPRLGARDHAKPERIRYAMVISVHAPKNADIYERVLAEFPELQALTPVTVQATV
jgi:subtilisin family serine protease